MSECKECGMPVSSGEYHPYAACLMFKSCRNSEVVQANLDVVVFHGVEIGETAVATECQRLDDTCATLLAENEKLRNALSDCDHQTDSMRVWGGMEWKYHPPQAKRIHDRAREVLDKIKGEK